MASKFKISRQFWTFEIRKVVVRSSSFNIVKIGNSSAKESSIMASNVDQFADLELSKEDREQIFDDPLDVSQPLTPQNGSR